MSKKCKIEIGSGNVYKDLGYDNPEEMLASSAFRAHLDNMIEIQKDNIINEYLRGYYNGLVLARAALLSIEPAFVEEIEDVNKCRWEWDSDGFYGTTCNHSFYFSHDGNEFEEEGFKWCPYCGEEIKPIKAITGDDDEN